MQVEAVKTKIVELVPALDGEVRGATDFGQVVDKDLLPQVPLGAFVMFGGWVGGEADAVTGLFRQARNESVSIVVFKRGADDPTGAKSQGDIEELIETLVLGLVGWAPAGDPFQLISAEITGFKKGGAVMAQIDIGLSDQLRIST